MISTLTSDVKRGVAFGTTHYGKYPFTGSTFHAVGVGQTHMVGATPTRKTLVGRNGAASGASQAYGLYSTLLPLSLSLSLSLALSAVRCSSWSFLPWRLPRTRIGLYARELYPESIDQWLLARVRTLARRALPHPQLYRMSTSHIYESVNAIYKKVKRTWTAQLSVLNDLGYWPSGSQHRTAIRTSTYTTLYSYYFHRCRLS